MGRMMVVDDVELLKSEKARGMPGSFARAAKAEGPDDGGEWAISPGGAKGVECEE